MTSAEVVPLDEHRARQLTDRIRQAADQLWSLLLQAHDGRAWDNAKKAIGVAWDLHACGESTPYVLVLSHELTGILGDMLARAMTGGAIHRIRVLELRDWTPAVRQP